MQACRLAHRVTFDPFDIPNPAGTLRRLAWVPRQTGNAPASGEQRVRHFAADAAGGSDHQRGGFCGILNFDGAHISSWVQ